MNALELDRLTVRYRGGTVDAVHELSLAVPVGEVHALLGPNGSGKSTAVAVLSTLVPATSGRARVVGHDVRDRPHDVRRAIGVTLQETSLEPTATARELLRRHGRLHGLARGAAAIRADELLAAVGLGASGDRTLRQFSGGMRRRLDLALGLVHRPAVVFLDEPTTGLDPGGRRDLWHEVRRLRDAGTTILLTTQYLEEADQLADRVWILAEGRLAATGTPEELKSRLGDDVVTLDVAPADRDAVAAVASRHGTVDTDATGGQSVRVTVAGAGTVLPRLFADLTQERLQVLGVRVARPTLDDVFLSLTGLPGTQVAA